MIVGLMGSVLYPMQQNGAQDGQGEQGQEAFDMPSFVEDPEESSRYLEARDVAAQATLDRVAFVRTTRGKVIPRATVVQEVVDGVPVEGVPVDTNEDHNNEQRRRS